jgi:P4 family phage/plasmid primase-like protien
MTDFDYEEIVRETAEEDLETKKIKEDHLKHIAEISKHLSEESEYEHLTRDEFEAELIKKYHFKATKDTEDLYYYEDHQGIFVKGGEWMIKRESLKYNPGITTSTVEQIMAHIIWGNYIDRSEFDSKIEWLCCKNVMVNLLTGETRLHSADFMATVRIPHTYPLYSHLSAPKIMRFFNQVMGPEDIETVLDFMAYCLWRAFPYHRWLLLNGSGRNGKGVTTNLISKLLGMKNVSSETLHRLLDNKFASGNLYGKMANIDADLSSQALKQTGLLKKITGADEIPGEFKFKPAFFFRNHAKLIFSANTMPITPDETDAFFARLLIINFPNQFLGVKANPNLIEELTTEREMSALLGLVVRRLPRVLKEGILYTASHTIEDNYLRYIRSSNPIRYFVETALRVDNGANVYVTKTDMHAAYGKFCDKNKFGTESSYTFSRELKKHGFLDIQVRTGGKKEPKTWVWRNVKLINWEKPEDDDQEVLDL